MDFTRTLSLYVNRIYYSFLWNVKLATKSFVYYVFVFSGINNVTERFREIMTFIAIFPSTFRFANYQTTKKKKQNGAIMCVKYVCGYPMLKNGVKIGHFAILIHNPHTHFGFTN